MMRAIRWRNRLRSFGSRSPFWLIHDVGLALVLGTEALPPQANDAYGKLLFELASTELAADLRTSRAPDAMIEVLLQRSLAPLEPRYRGPALPAASSFDLPADVAQGLQALLPRNGARTGTDPYLQGVRIRAI